MQGDRLVDIEAEEGMYRLVEVPVVEIRIARTYDFLLKLIKQLYRTTCIESITN